MSAWPVGAVGAVGADPADAAPVGAVGAALTAAWRGADPGPTVPELRPPARRRWPADAVSVPLPRWPDPGIGGLLDLALAGDPLRKVAGVRLRRVPSAGGRYPIEAHIVGDRLAWRYDPLAHRLCAPARVAGASGTCVVLSLNPIRTWWRYGARSLPVLLLDLGHAIASVLAAASAIGYPARAELGRPGPELSALAGLPWRGGAVRWPGCAPEYPMAVVYLDGLGGFDGRGRLDGLNGFDGPGRLGGPNLPGTERRVTAHAPLPERGSPGDGPQASGLESVMSAMTELASGLPRPVTWDASALVVPTNAIQRRCSSGWARVCAGTVDVEQARALSPRAIPVRPESLATDLEHRACGQPEVAEAGALLLFTGAGSVADYVGAGIAAHQAWLTATRHGVPVRPVGCWIDAVLSDGRLLHALALGGCDS